MGLERGVSPVIRTVDFYEGEPAAFIDATQLQVEPRVASRIVREWCDFFAAGPSPILELAFVSRTPARLWNSLAAQTQLRTLSTKWGDYSDLPVLGEMRELRELHLGSAPAIASLAQLAPLDQLETLELENTWRVSDYSPIGRLRSLRSLSVTDGLHGRPLRADSIEFIRGLRQLQSLRWMPAIASLDYSPLLELTWVKEMWIHSVRGMSPSIADLEWALPGMQAVRAIGDDEPDYQFVPFIVDGDFVGELRTDDRGRTVFYPADGGDPQAVG